MSNAVFLALVLAWCSGFGAAGALDAVWGFTEWDAKGILLVSMFCGVFGMVSLMLVIEL